jgi:hypothetical protein
MITALLMRSAWCRFWPFFAGKRQTIMAADLRARVGSWILRTFARRNPAMCAPNRSGTCCVRALDDGTRSQSSLDHDFDAEPIAEHAAGSSECVGGGMAASTCRRNDFH